MHDAGLADLRNARTMTDDQGPRWQTPQTTAWQRPCYGFTLIELLVVVSIIGLLMSVLLPTLTRAREKATSLKCLAHIRGLGQGMLIYHVEYGNFPTHQWRLPDGSRLRWFNALVDVLGELEIKGGRDVRSCPAVPEWEIGRNNSYGYNYKYVGSTRDNVAADNRYRPYETFPVKELAAPARTIAFGDCDGTGWKLEWGPERGPNHPEADHDPDRLGNHGYVMDPTYIPLRNETTYSGGELEPYAWHNVRSYLSDRHGGEGNVIFVDGHGGGLEPRRAYEDNALWNGLGYDVGCDPETPGFELDPHVAYKYDESSGQGWRY